MCFFIFLKLISDLFESRDKIQLDCQHKEREMLQFSLLNNHIIIPPLLSVFTTLTSFIIDLKIDPDHMPSLLSCLLSSENDDLLDNGGL